MFKHFIEQNTFQLAIEYATFGSEVQQSVCATGIREQFALSRPCYDVCTFIEKIYIPGSNHDLYIWKPARCFLRHNDRYQSSLCRSCNEVFKFYCTTYNPVGGGTYGHWIRNATRCSLRHRDGRWLHYVNHAMEFRYFIEQVADRTNDFWIKRLRCFRRNDRDQSS